MAEQIWDSFARLNAGERFKRQSAEMGSAVTEAIVEEARVDAGGYAATDAAPAAGAKVLDVACGSGEPSISIAALLGNAGEVIGVDMAAEPLKVARERAAKRGLTNVEYMQADVHALPFADASFDRVTSRLGVMFFGDLPKALGELHRVLKPGGRVALLAWGAMEQPYFDLTIGTVRRLRPELEVPATARQMFKFGVGGTLSGALREAGFADAEDHVRSLRWDWHGSPEELWDYFRSVTVPFRALLEKVEGDAEVNAAVLAALGERFDGEYVRLQAQMVVATGRKGQGSSEVVRDPYRQV
jgi:ubiquinone/menaquinone biosynthesis C-methylase UbiE